MIGTDPQTGTLRWTMGSLYLWEGLPLVPLTLGIFALPELCDLAIGRTAGDRRRQDDRHQDRHVAGHQGLLRHTGSWSCAARGSAPRWARSPASASSVIDWIAYGHALRTEKGAQQTFGKGDVRGVIAAESATNAREGGALVPTVAFGVPGGAGMAILLGAFLIHGLVPGPDMLTKNLDITYSMVWSIAIANILGCRPLLPLQRPVRQARDAALHADPAVRAVPHLYRRVRGHAAVGRSLFAAVLRRARLGA